MKSRKVPLRMCIACREMLPKAELIRVVRDTEGNITLDHSGKKAGRGAYICKSDKCIAKCIKTKAINRNFRKDIDVDIYNKIEEESNREQ